MYTSALENTELKAKLTEKTVFSLKWFLRGIFSGGALILIFIALWKNKTKLLQSIKKIV